MNLLASTGEFSYDTVAILGKRSAEPELVSIDRYQASGSGATTDLSVAIDELEAVLPRNMSFMALHVWANTGAGRNAAAISHINVFVEVGRYLGVHGVA